MRKNQNNESRRGPRSDYDFEQMDRPSYERDMSERNSRDFSGNFPSSELSNSGCSEFGSDRPWSQYPNEQNYGQAYGQSSSQGIGQGAHAGKGPKGYQRSEERIREEVCDALEAHAQVDASEIEVEISEGVVTLTGSVDSRMAKRLAEHAVESVRGVKDVHNQLQIMSSNEIQRLGSGSGFTQKGKNAKSGKKSNTNYKQ